MPSENYPLELVGSDILLAAVPVSFETNEQWATAVKLPTLPFRCKLKSVKTAVTKALAGTDAGTVLVKKGSTTYATVTIAISAALGEEDEASSPTGTAFETTDQISLFATKSTAGGRALVYITVEVLPSHAS